jgi:hypothetical protein
MSESLESRVAQLERKTDRMRSLPWTMLALTFAVVYAVVIQYQINSHLSERAKAVYRIEVAEEPHAPK